MLEEPSVPLRLLGQAPPGPVSFAVFFWVAHVRIYCEKAISEADFYRSHEKKLLHVPGYYPGFSKQAHILGLHAACSRAYKTAPPGLLATKIKGTRE